MEKSPFGFFLIRKLFLVCSWYISNLLTLAAFLQLLQVKDLEMNDLALQFFELCCRTVPEVSRLGYIGPYICLLAVQLLYETDGAELIEAMVYHDSEVTIISDSASLCVIRCFKGTQNLSLITSSRMKKTSL